MLKDIDSWRIDTNLCTTDLNGVVRSNVSYWNFAYGIVSTCKSIALDPRTENAEQELDNAFTQFMKDKGLTLIKYAQKHSNALGDLKADVMNVLK